MREFLLFLMSTTDVPSALRRLPGLSNELVTEVLKANPNTVVVTQSGSPVEMPWVNEAHSLVQVWVY